ncbi:hypothetical protein ACIQNT_11310 [Streptomyces luteogriseus]|uniref:hypothetical protein n=1 Tax=Streptomyces luteogriseus TaxID=68233 RepID=UPI0037FB80DF
MAAPHRQSVLCEFTSEIVRRIDTEAEPGQAALSAAPRVHELGVHVRELPSLRGQSPRAEENPSAALTK